MWFNTTTSPFLLTGFPGMEKAHHLISIPLLVAYISILLGNGTLLFLIRDDHNLHEPMYYFLAMLAATDLGVTLTTMPTVLGVLWLNHREIGHGACFSQAYFIHTLSIVESGVLLAMAYDRFIAIRNPLRYAFILTDTQDVIKLACADITFNRLYPVVVVFAMVLLDFLIIFFSYILILKTVMGIASRDERAKALNTCVSHICCILVFYVTVVGLTFIHRDDHNLHEPMYYFLAMLAATDLGVTLTTMPTVLGVLWLNHREIGHGACFSQAYFIHTLSIVESGVLLAMAYDRFIAIRNPLRYAFILTDTQDVIKLACADITFNHLYPVVVVFAIGLLDFLVIFFSYILILKTVMGIASRDERAKALNTCVSHICCILVFYVSVAGLTFIHSKDEVSGAEDKKKVKVKNWRHEGWKEEGKRVQEKTNIKFVKKMSR
ncbi:Hypothetical predicted protein [Marmota monax]|uniref:G-protein coupled receptors family 1 profile domain-containing protein n=1 Tax=Marmota monax TaxID=9995 RepID=A0A5E4CWI1_MARMO|nr:Hypothetical predicted protein [Marmota monax]